MDIIECSVTLLTKQITWSSRLDKNFSDSAKYLLYFLLQQYLPKIIGVNTERNALYQISIWFFLKKFVFNFKVTYFFPVTEFKWVALGVGLGFRSFDQACMTDSISLIICSSNHMPRSSGSSFHSSSFGANASPSICSCWLNLNVDTFPFLKILL